MYACFCIFKALELYSHISVNKYLRLLLWSLISSAPNIPLLVPEVMLIEIMHNLIGMAERHLRAKPVGLREDTRPAQGKVKHTRNYKEIKKKRFRWITSMYVCMYVVQSTSLLLLVILFTWHDDGYNIRKWDLPLLIRIIQITLIRQTLWLFSISPRDESRCVREDVFVSVHSKPTYSISPLQKERTFVTGIPFT